ncbi:MAG: HAD family hydrolase [Sulfuricurvum sp.]|uniref:HAD family hydrolase n=1 Tax=Sulfuricurvum sp. TaxID=2025608 RepID=UPI00262CE1C9|nr:HAD family hydrolase [Sulfuricurvum sp.]MDD2829032.1 HAD family hydrolase [Sulfuricurvum sp.]MDD4949679.1 HAD family hydrolase [Sulfuricurvum sp.]
MKKIVIFDMDGTLINSAQDITISINYVRNQLYTLPPLDKSYIIEAINAHDRNLAELFYQTVHYEEGAKVLFEEHYHEQCIQNVYSYNEIVETLECLQSRGCNMSVATNAPSTFAHRMLNYVGIAPFFSSIIGADNVKFPKPHPQMIELLLEHHGYNPMEDSAWMIGDNSKDMMAGSEASINTIFAAWGFTNTGLGERVAFSPLEIVQFIFEE